MPQFKVDSLTEKAKLMHNAQLQWRNRNWKETLSSNCAQLEELLALIELLDIWKIYLPKSDTVKQLRKEIVSDAYGSIHLACFGLYKYAYMSLRSQFETAARLIYFSSHPQEYELWKSGNEQWTKLLKSSDVWGNNWTYFSYFFAEVEKLNNIPAIMAHNYALSLDKGNSPKLQGVYRKLSKYVHSVGPALQTRSGRLSPKYDQTEFTEWNNVFKDVQKYVNILFALCFVDEFKKMIPTEREQILDQAIGVAYKEPVKQVCGL